MCVCVCVCVCVKVRVERNGQYLWRHIPAKESCTISAESDPPSIMTDITVSGVEIEREGLQEGPVMFVHFELTWLPPSTANGILLEYEIAVGTTASGPTDLLYRFTYPVSAWDLSLSLSLPLSLTHTLSLTHSLSVCLSLPLPLLPLSLSIPQSLSHVCMCEYSSSTLLHCLYHVWIKM